jgi:MoxR-like ATPase
MSSTNNLPTPLDKIHLEMAKVIVGQSDVIEQMLITVVCDGHSLIEGVAGLGKWLAVQALALGLGLEARKLRCTPDLSIKDIVGRDVDDVGETPTRPGALISNLVLVDNVDRLAPKADSLIQQAMQERVVLTPPIRLPDPFVVFANRHLKAEQPSNSEHSELHDDRYLFKIAVPYPPYHNEYGISGAPSRIEPGTIQQVLSAEELGRLKDQVKSAEASPSVVHYAVRLVRATRVHEGENLDFIYEFVQQGAGPRAVQILILAANARAILRGRSTVQHEDVAAMALPTLRHRIITNRNAQENGISVDRVIQRLLEDVPPRIVGDETPPKAGEAFSVHNWTPRE